MEVSGKELQRRRRLRYGTQAVILTISVIGLMVLAFVAVNKTLWRFDFTANRSFTLSIQTRDVLGSLKQPVTIRAFFRPGGDVDQVFIRRKVDDVLQEYSERSSQIDYKMIDPDAAVEEAVAFGIHTEGTIVFASKDRRKDVYQSGLFEYPSLGENSIPLFVGESLFTNALLSLAQQEIPFVCFLSGHGERKAESPKADGLARIVQMLGGENYEVETISFARNADWASRCDVLVVAGPKMGFHRREDQSILQFLRAGKKLILMVDPQSALGLTQTLQELGVSFQAGVVFDPKRHFLLGPHYPGPVLADHPITQKMTEQNISPVLYLARPLTHSESTESAYRVTELLSTSEVAWGELDLKTQTKPERNVGRDLEGPLVLGVAIAAADAESESEQPVALVFGDSNFITNGLIEIPGNSDLLLNGIAWLVGNQEQVTIRARKPDFRPLILEEGEARLVAIATQLLYPGLILGGGLTYWWRRRRK